ncbi:hypothetical protein [Chitinimonas lacunae]|uniref:Uncharacterized protein n=1 Tax=Chitinimonas lacunae TaxID=1963018 RepID=A0ABV8MV83_9NEIS
MGLTAWKDYFYFFYFRLSILHKVFLLFSICPATVAASSVPAGQAGWGEDGLVAGQEERGRQDG